MKLPLLTNSRIKTYRSCQRKHKLRYVDGYRAVRSNENQRFGTLIHAGLEAFFKAYRAPERLDLALAAVASEPDAFERAKAEAGEVDGVQRLRASARNQPRRQIGRASCRERVWLLV